jgi:hypothetical protein
MGKFKGRMYVHLQYVCRGKIVGAQKYAGRKFAWGAGWLAA